MSLTSCARSFSAAFIALFLASPFVARAAVILPGGGIPTPPSVAPPLGPLLFGGVPVPFTGPGTNGFSGTITSSVYGPDVNDPAGLTFTYVFHNNASSATSIERVNMADFTGFSTDVSYVLATGQVPSATDRSKAPAGAVVGWDFTGVPVGLGTIAPGTDSATLVIRTDAPQYDLTQAASVIDGSVVSVASIGPSNTLIQPEPGSLALLAVGGFVLGRTGRRKRS